MSLRARAAVAVYWVIDLDASVMTVHENPGADGYATVGQLGAGERATVTDLGLDIAIADILAAAQR